MHKKNFFHFAPPLPSPSVKKTVWKEASINRAMSCLRHLLRKTIEWEMIERSPFDKGKSLVLKKNNTQEHKKKAVCLPNGLSTIKEKGGQKDDRQNLTCHKTVTSLSQRKPASM